MSNYLIIGDDIDGEHILLKKINGEIIYRSEHSLYSNDNIISMRLNNDIFTLLPEKYKYHYVSDVNKLYKQADKIIIIVNVKTIKNIKFWLSRVSDFNDHAEIIIILNSNDVLSPYIKREIDNININVHILYIEHATREQIINIL
jgi:hypothetical protein